MRKLIAWVVLLCGFMPVLWAADGCDQHLSREEFRAKQKEFITEQAGLSKKEATKFFPVYFELQDNKTYLGKFKKILSSKKIFLVQRAEMRFHREMIKGMNRGKDKGNDSKKK